MNIPTILALAIYAALILSLIWARFWFFNIQSIRVTIWVVLYDPMVAIQVFGSLYGFWMVENLGTLKLASYIIALLIAFSLFWWSILTAKKLDFAFSNKVGELITSGPYSIVRHPFYVSYIIIWSSSTLIFNSVFLWITLLYLVTFYFVSARKEEKVILSSDYSSEYLKYRQRVGMFLPRIKKWKN